MPAPAPDPALAARAPRWGALDRAQLARAADGLAVAVAVVLPWSTSLTGILTVLWLLAVIPTLDRAALRAAPALPAAGLALALVALAALGTLWADIPWPARGEGFASFVKLLVLPLLLVQFAGSPRGHQVLIGFVISMAAAMLLSWGYLLFPPPWHTGDRGVPVRDRIFLGEAFVLCAFALMPLALEAWQQGAHRRALALGALIAAFLLDVVYAATSRTAFVLIGVLALLFGFRRTGWRGLLIAGVMAAALGATALALSPQLRERMATVGPEVAATLSTGENTSAGARVVFWMRSFELLRQRPLLGHGTGSIRAAFQSLAPDAPPAANPHNQILATGIQLGALGVAVLIALWLAHGRLFRGASLVCWLGLATVVQHVVASLFNSHLFDFAQGWLYVFAVGVLGGMALRERATSP